MKRRNKLIIITVSLAFIYSSLYAVPLNVLNNNPVNIEYKKDVKWIGSVYKSGRYEQFYTKAYGLRAGRMVVRNNIRKTVGVEEFVERLACDEGEDRNTPHIRNYINAIKFFFGEHLYIKDTDRLLELIVVLEGGIEAEKYYKDRY